MSIPHPKGRIIEMMAKAICCSSRSSEYWNSLTDKDKEGWRRDAEAALSVVEPAVVWGHFIKTDEYSDELIY